MHDFALILWKFYRRYLLFVLFFVICFGLAAIGDALRAFRAHPVASVIVVSIALWIAAAWVVLRRKEKFDVRAAREWILDIWNVE